MAGLWNCTPVFSIVGVAGVMWIFVALYLLTAVLALALAQPSEERADHA